MWHGESAVDPTTGVIRFVFGSSGTHLAHSAELQERVPDRPLATNSARTPSAFKKVLAGPAIIGGPAPLRLTLVTHPPSQSTTTTLDSLNQTV